MVSLESNQTTYQMLDSLGDVAAALRRVLGDSLLALVVFGSRARGEATGASDWDLLVVARDLPENVFERHLRLKALLPSEWRGKVALLARTPAEIEYRLSSLMLDIALDGVVVYDPEGYAARRLAGLRKLIEKRGLHRERVGKDLIWRWEHFPGFDWTLEWEEGL